jgi:23S rRNA (pseudouridine1915-N3)-methyltransferase
MQRITFLIVGKIKTSWIAEGFELFQSRLEKQLSFNVVTIPPSKNIDPKKMSEEETERIAKVVSSFDGDVWLLEETGKELTSPQFAELLGKAKDTGRSLLFILGGPYGVTAALKASIKNHLALSAMTLPHELCALLFLEQMYRGCEIQKGTGYHH